MDAVIQGIQAFVQSSQEVQHWGFNVLTFGAIGATLFTFLEFWALYKQSQTIWDNESGESISVIWFVYCLCLFPTFFFYGIHVQSLTSIFNGVMLSVVHIPIVLGLWKYKGFTTGEKIQFAALSLMIPIMAFLPWKDEIFMIVSLGLIYFTATQPWTLWREKKVGDLDIRLVVVYLISTSFWVPYSFAIDAWALQILSSVNLVLFCITAILWFKYKTRASHLE